MGMSLAAVTGPVVAAYVILRCAPPIGVDLPPDWGLVSPVTAAGDVDVLRRAARLGLEGMAAIGAALLDPIVSALLIAIGGRMKRLKTAKQPILFTEVAAAFAKAKANPTFIAVRDAFALVLGFHFAMRASELLSLVGRDLSIVAEGTAVQIRFPNVKNRQTVFSSHDPFIVTASGDLLIEAYILFNSTIGFRDDLSVFHAIRASTEKPLSRDWLAGVVAAAAPKRTPHSLRVGAATELYACGVDITTIMAIGRWTSTAALLYVLGTLEDTIGATSVMGKGGLRITTEGLRKATRSSMPANAVAQADVARWVAACAAPQ
jgi:integrase